MVNFQIKTNQKTFCLSTAGGVEAVIFVKHKSFTFIQQVGAHVDNHRTSPKAHKGRCNLLLAPLAQQGLNKDQSKVKL